MLKQPSKEEEEKQVIVYLEQSELEQQEDIRSTISNRGQMMEELGLMKTYDKDQRNKTR